MSMLRQTWRWFGPQDKVTLADAAQAGVEGIVTALHHVPPGEIWTEQEINRRIGDIEGYGGMRRQLRWEVVESLPVSEDIKLHAGDWRRHIDNYRASLANLAACGLRTVCYNFMPVLDWTRTDLAWLLDHGGTAMRFDLVDFAAFDIHVLGRGAAAGDYPEQVQAAAARRAQQLGAPERDRLAANILAGLPGSVESWTLEKVSQQLDRYADVDADQLRANLRGWLEEVVPAAERLGVRLCCHPDDPPFGLLGLPRIVSTESDLASLVDCVPSPANGILFCAGSLGARPDNDLPGIVRRLGDKINFVHLRSVSRDSDDTPCSFFEDEHLAGHSELVAVLAALMEIQRDPAAGPLAMRPDHGQDILDDLHRGASPGYPAIGRLKGLAELRGVMHALRHAQRG